MDLEFVAPNLRALDQVAAELVLCHVWRDERPMRGLAGLLDWRMGGRLSALCKQHFLVGGLGEPLLTRGPPKLSFEKVLCVGLGTHATFSETVFRQAVRSAFSTLHGLKAGRAIMELPGRSGNLVTPERAAELLVECLPPGEFTLRPDLVLVEEPEMGARFQTRLSEELRRVVHLEGARHA